MADVAFLKVALFEFDTKIIRRSEFKLHPPTPAELCGLIL